MIVRLTQYKDHSVITLFSNKDEHLGSIVYKRSIHEYESGADYKTLSTEHDTYGDDALVELFNYFASIRR